MLPRSVMTAVALAAMLSGDAHAFAPQADEGHEPVRIRTYDAATQVRWMHQPSWVEFTQGEGQGWLARFDQETGTPHRMWGPGIDIGRTDTARQVEQGLMAFLQRQHDVLGVPATSLRVKSVNYSTRNDTWYVDVDTIVQGGAKIWRGGVTARVERGKLVMLGVDTYPDVPVEGRVVLTQSEAIASAIQHGPAPTAVHTDQGAELVAVPVDQGGLHLQLCWLVSTRTASPPGWWQTLVDASTGDVVGSWNQVRYVDGEVDGYHQVRTFDGNWTTTGLPLVKVTSSDGTFYTDESGHFTTTGEATDFTSTLNGQYMNVKNEAGNEGKLIWTDGSTTGTWTTDAATQAEISAYAYLHVVRQWGETYGPDLGWVTDKQVAHVNENQTCNAYWDGELHFFEAGGGCNNTGEIADVTWHEWGHGFHYYSLKAGTFDASLSEGAADVVAFFNTGDHDIAPWFWTNGDPIRDVEPDKVYPKDYVADDLYSHDNGLIFGGAIWDLWQILVDEEGWSTGTYDAATIYANLLQGGPDIEQSYDEAVVGDDDDGDLGNGTPHLCEIIDAFSRHGLGPTGSGGSNIQLVSTPVQSAVADEPIDVSASIYNLAPQCIDWAPTDGTLHWRVAGGTWQQLAANVAGMDVTAQIPAQPMGTTIEYWFEASDGTDAVDAPTGGSINPYTFYVGDVLTVSCEDFEGADGKGSDGGYTHALVLGNDQLGADDWQLGAPQGEAGDPKAPYSGNFEWGNDLGDGDWNGEYQPNITNRLTSNVIDTKWYTGTFLQYQRWLTVEDGHYDKARILADGAEVWRNHNSAGGEEHHEDMQWQVHVVDLKGNGDDGSVQLAWEIASDPGLQLGGWNIDDVCVYAPATPDNRLGIVDFQATDGDQDAVTLTWTNPIHDPVERVVVVRSEDGYPSGPTDGTVVYDDSAPEVGVSMEAVDSDVEGGTTYYYAVYASDGTDWLSWTKEGWNADTGEAEVPVGPPTVESKCGCSTTSPGAASSAGGLALALAALVARRRRRA